jgi:hypothetical protein
MGPARRMLLLAAALVLALGLAVTGCRKDSDGGGGGTPGYQPAPSRQAPAADA